MLQSMYANCALCVRAHDGVGESFSAELGVKQGDPLSPLLFGLYVDRITSFLSRRLPESGVRVGGSLLACLLYADDLVLLAHDTQTLQHLLDALSLFCQATRLTVNIAKTVYMVFHKQYMRVPNIGVTYNGVSLEQVQTFVYLGVIFHSKGHKDGAKKAMQRRMEKAHAALYAMMATCQELRIHDPMVLCALFDTLVLPCLLYGVEQWGPALLVGQRGDVLHRPEVERIQSTFLRMVLMVKKSTPLMCIRSELRRHPVPVDCIMMCARFWNRLCGLGEESLVERCWKENLGLGEGSWSQGMRHLRQAVWGAHAPIDDGPWDLEQCGTLLKQREASHLDQETRLCMEATFHPDMLGNRVRCCPPEVREGFKSFKHTVWFSQPEGQVPVLWQLPEPGNVRVLAQYRLGAHHLACETDRGAGLRDSRLCTFCQDMDMEDELHVLLCSAWQEYRDRFPVLFQGRDFVALVEASRSGFEVDDCMRAVVNSQDRVIIDSLAGYLKLVDKARTQPRNILVQ